MSEDQQTEFIAFMKTLFPEIEVNKNVYEAEREVEYENRKNRRWSKEEYVLLFGPENNEELARRLDREIMSISMKRAEFVPDLLNWAEHKGLNLNEANVKELVERYEEEART